MFLRHRCVIINKVQQAMHLAETDKFQFPSQTLQQTKGKNMLIRIDGPLAYGVTSKDIILHICGLIGTAGGTGYTIEFGGSAISSLSMEARMSISNMAIEAGARAGVIAPDDITFE